MKIFIWRLTAVNLPWLLVLVVMFKHRSGEHEEDQPRRQMSGHAT
jgi:hypothetical protein